jgi:hypothetical protein
MNHEQKDLLSSLRQSLPKDVMLVGCSVQGMVSDESVREGGFALGLMGLGGDELLIAPVLTRDIEQDTHSKGQDMGARLKSQLGLEPNLILLLWDPLCGADMDQLLSGIKEFAGCPIVGGGAGQPWGRMVRTVQYWEDEVLSHGSIAIGLSGPFSVELGVTHGTSPTGTEMTVTRSEGNRLVEIDGKPALLSWREMTGCTEEQIIEQDYSSNWAIGIQRKLQHPDGSEETLYFVRAAFGFDLEAKELIVPTSIPQGERIMIHHRTVENILSGTETMGQDLKERINGKQPWAVFGFECAARTAPFLGSSATMNENLTLRKTVAPDTPWLGMMAWGEVAPVGGTPAFHNYTYPLVVLCRT